MFYSRDVLEAEFLRSSWFLDVEEIFVTRECNNDCLFCSTRERRFSPEWEQLKFQLYQLKEKGLKRVSFTGGEPTTYPRLFELIDLAKRLGFKTIEVRSNGRNYKDMAFVKKLVDCGVNFFHVAIHGYNKEIQDFLTQKENSFIETASGLRNLDQFKNIYVRTMSVIVKQNYKSLPFLVNQLSEYKNVKCISFAFPHPVSNAMKNKDKIISSLREVNPYILEALDLIDSLNIDGAVDNYPPCLLRSREKFLEHLFLCHLSQAIPYPACVHKERCLYGKFCESINPVYFEDWGIGQVEPIALVDIRFNDSKINRYLIFGEYIPALEKNMVLIETSQGGVLKNNNFFVVLKPLGVEFIKSLGQGDKSIRDYREKKQLELIRFMLNLYQRGAIYFVSAKSKHKIEPESQSFKVQNALSVEYLYEYPMAVMPHPYPEYEFIESNSN